LRYWKNFAIDKAYAFVRKYNFVGAELVD